MSDTSILLPTGQRVDGEQLTVSATAVVRQRFNIADPASATGLATVPVTQPTPTEPGLSVRPITRGSSAAISRVNDTATSTLLKSANSGRISLTIVNDSSALLYVSKGNVTVSATVYTYKLNQDETLTIDDYTGQVNGVWATDPGDGGAQITEVTT